jgi:hypothetical protein
MLATVGTMALAMLPSILGSAAEYYGQKKSLEYLKEREAVPRRFSEAALTELGGLYGLTDDTGTQQEMIERAKASPLYSEIMGGMEEGEQAILRSASATGGLRGGGVQTALADYATRLSNKALLASYNQQLQGLTGMAGLPSYAQQIASGYAGLGETAGRGISGAGQSGLRALQMQELLSKMPAGTQQQQTQPFTQWAGYADQFI